MNTVFASSNGFCVHRPPSARGECANVFQVRFSQSGDRPVAHCRGRLVYGASAEPLRFAILWNRRLLLDFRRVESIDAAGLGMLAQLHVLASVMDTTVEVCGVDKRIRHLLRLTNLDSVLRIRDEEGDTTCAVSA